MYSSSDEDENHLAQFEDLMKGVDVTYKRIETIRHAENALSKLEDEQMLAMDCEGVIKNEMVSLIQLGAKNKPVYLFDIQQLGNKVFDLGLKELLENEQVCKVLYGCPGDYTSLDQGSGVYMRNIVDLQVLEWYCRGRQNGSYTLQIKGLKFAAGHYVDDEILKDMGVYDIDSVNTAGKNVFKYYSDVYKERPLPKYLKTYAALDVKLIWLLVEGLQNVVDIDFDDEDDVMLKRLKSVSMQYAQTRSTKAFYCF